MDDIPEIEVETKAKPTIETNPRTSYMESWISRIQAAKEAI